MKTPKAERTDNGAQFYCIVKNSAAAVQSKTAILSVFWPPKILKEPSDCTVKEGSRAELSVEVGDGNPPSYEYEWFIVTNGFPGEPVGTNSPKLIFEKVKKSDMGYYDCEIRNSGGGAITTTVFLTVQ